MGCLNGSNRGWPASIVGLRSVGVLGFARVLMGFGCAGAAISVVVLDPSLSAQPKLLVVVAVATGSAGSAQTPDDGALALGAVSLPALLASLAAVVVCDGTQGCLPVSPAPKSQNSAALLADGLYVLLDQLLSSSCQLLRLLSDCLKLASVDGCHAATGVTALGSLSLPEPSRPLLGLRLQLEECVAAFWNLGGVWYVGRGC